MDSDKKRKELQQEIAELTALIEGSSSANDSETLWAVYLLETCLERRKRELLQLLH